MEFVKAYRVIEFYGINNLNEWLDENRDIEVISITIKEVPLSMYDKYVLLYRKVI